jgi:iron complex transport system substrate-binding protein
MALLTVALALVLGGCAETREESESRLKVAHAGGETIVPARAERVVALEPDALETALALGVPVVGAASVKRDGTLQEHLGRRGSQIPGVGRAQDVDLSAVKAADPDLILGSKRRHGSLYRELKEIAPTVLTEETGAAWKLNLRLQAEALNRPDAGERALRDYDRRVGPLARRLTSTRPRQKVSVLRAAPNGVQAYTRDSFAGIILADAALARPAAQAVRKRPFVRVRRLQEHDGDLLLLSRAPDGGEALTRLVSSPAWRRLGAVRAGRVRRMSDDAWFTGQGILSARQAVRELSRLTAG